MNNNPKDDNMSCCARFRADLRPCQSYWSVQDQNGYKIDVQESFCTNTPFSLLMKVLALGVSAATLALGIEAFSLRFFTAYLTYVSLCFATLYQLMDLFNALRGAQQPPALITGRIRWTWILFLIACHAELVVTVFWWATIYDGGMPKVRSVLAHGGVAFFVFVNGFFVNRIPIRWYHWYGIIQPFNLCYIGWTVIHAYLDIGNPNTSDNDPETNDDLIYDAVDWEGDLTGTIIVIAILYFGLSPLSFTLMWLASLKKYILCGPEKRVYIDKESNEIKGDERPTVNDVEEGSIFSFSKWW